MATNIKIEVSAPKEKISSAISQVRKGIFSEEYEFGRYLIQTIGGDSFLIEKTSKNIYVEWLDKTQYIKMLKVFNDVSLPELK